MKYEKFINKIKFITDTRIITTSFATIEETNKKSFEIVVKDLSDLGGSLAIYNEITHEVKFVNQILQVGNNPQLYKYLLTTETNIIIGIDHGFKDVVTEMAYRIDEKGNIKPLHVALIPKIK